jgi:hypothetical protein
MVRRFLFQNLSYANIVATLALVLAVTGGAYAATQLPKNSVGSKQVKDSSLKAKDFKPGQLPAGATGPQGPAGAKGAAGPTGPAGPSVVVTGGMTVGQRVFTDGCPNAGFESTTPLTVDVPTVIWADTRVSYSPLGSGLDQTHTGSVVVRIYDAGHFIRAETTSSSAYLVNGTSGQFGTAGILRDVSGAEYVLQPGASYTIGTEYGVSSGSCGSGTSQVTNGALDWIGFPAAS